MGKNKKILITEEQRDRLFYDDNIFNIDKIDINNLPDDDPYDEDDFNKSLFELANDGAMAFNAIKDLFSDHPYALNNPQKVERRLKEIENIVNLINKLYE